MSLLKLKSKTEPLYTNKSIINYDDDLNKEIKETINKNKVNSSLIIGEGATIKGEIIEENEITVNGSVDGDIQCKNLIVGKTGSIKGKIKSDTLYVLKPFIGLLKCTKQYIPLVILSISKFFTRDV